MATSLYKAVTRSLWPWVTAAITSKLNWSSYVTDFKSVYIYINKMSYHLYHNNLNCSSVTPCLCDYIFFPAHKGLIASIFCQSGLSFNDNCLPTSSKQMHSSEMRGLLPWFCKCDSVWKSALNNSVTNTASNQVLSHSLLKILITELWEIASQLHVWQVSDWQRHAEADG